MHILITNKEVDIAVGFALEEKSFEIFIFIMWKIVIVLSSRTRGRKARQNSLDSTYKNIETPAIVLVKR